MKRKKFYFQFSGSLLYLYQLFRKLEMERFDGQAGGTQSSNIPRDDLEQAAAEYRSESGSDSEAEPDHISAFRRHARGVDAKLVSTPTLSLFERKSNEIHFCEKQIFKIEPKIILDSTVSIEG